MALQVRERDRPVATASCLFIGGLATILQSFGVVRVPAAAVQHVTASVATMTAIVADSGLPGVFGAVTFSAALGLLIAPFFLPVIRFFHRSSPSDHATGLSSMVAARCGRATTRRRRTTARSRTSRWPR
ncbi:hypothetical protein HBB16_07210 [Pseudonocardia sp. MCCB 268]|nr:hypothetical protein [Pseudonocardia cytotoxica]